MRRLASVMIPLLVIVPATVAAAKPSNVLYAMDARSAVIAPSGGSLRLSMPASTTVTWFTDRPERRVGAIQLGRFCAVWKASALQKDPPNAALILTHDASEYSHVVELRKPMCSGGRVSFALRAISDGLVSGHTHTDDLAAGRFERARLFTEGSPFIP